MHTGFASLPAAELRRWIQARSPFLTKAVGRIPVTTDLVDSQHTAQDELEELREMAKAVPQPLKATTADHFFFTQQVLPRVLCQVSRNMILLLAAR